MKKPAIALAIATVAALDLIVMVGAGLPASATGERLLAIAVPTMDLCLSLTARHVWLLGRGEVTVSAQKVSLVRLALGGVDDDRRLVELLGPHREVRLRLPRRINTLTADDQRSIGRLVAEHLGLPLQAA
jgi:hypothetical protein